MQKFISFTYTADEVRQEIIEIITLLTFNYLIARLFLHIYLALYFYQLNSQKCAVLIYFFYLHFSVWILGLGFGTQTSWGVPMAVIELA